MNRLLSIFTFLTLAGTSAPETGWAQVLRGVQTGPRAPVAGSHSRELAGSVAGLINFDELSAPCLFFFTVALTDEYDPLGVTFSGPGGFNGGAVLDECSNFGVTGYSPPNFLAFNSESDLADGGIPDGPETLTFTPPVDSVRISGGSVEAIPIMMECFDDLGASMGSSSITATPALQTLRVANTGIETCVLSFTGESAAFDDLVYEMAIFIDGFETGVLSAWSSSTP